MSKETETDANVSSIPTPTLAFELQDEAEERDVRAFLDGLDANYYLLRSEGVNEGVTSYGVIIVHSGDMISVGSALAPRGS